MCHLISSPIILSFFSQRDRQSLKKTSTKMYYFPYFQGRVPAWNLAGLLPPDPTSPGPGGPSPGAVSAPGGLAHPLPHYSGAYGSQPATPVHYSHLLPQGNLLKGIKVLSLLEACFDLISSPSPFMKVQIMGGKITEYLGFESPLR